MKPAPTSIAAHSMISILPTQSYLIKSPTYIANQVNQLNRMNSKAVLLTSIPPFLRGIKFSEGEIDSLQKVAISSWYSAGLHIVSVHTSAELLRHPEHMHALSKHGVEILEAEPTDGQFPDYLPNLASAFNSLLFRHPRSVIAITNADIIFSDPMHIRELLSDIGDTNFILSHRLDVSTISTPPSSGTTYCNGLDFFVASSSVLKRSINFLPSVLTFGLPWWDLYLPLAMLAAGARPLLDRPNYYLHQAHIERWSLDYFYKIGAIADREFLQLSKKCAVESQIYNWHLQRKNAINAPLFSPTFFLRLKLRAKILIKERKFHPLHLTYIVNIILDLLLLNKMSTAGDE